MLSLKHRIQRNRSFKSNDAYMQWQRRRLWEHDPRCHWCRRVTVLPKYNGRLRQGQVQPNWATLEHLDARHSIERGKHHGEFRRVLACWKCNNERDKRELAALPAQTKWELSRSIYGIAKLHGALNEVDGWNPRSR